MTLDEYQDLKAEVDALRRRAAQLDGVLARLDEELRAEFGTDAKGAAKLLKELTGELERGDAELAKEERAFEKLHAKEVEG